MSASQIGIDPILASVPDPNPFAEKEARKLRVLTLTPFYPSLEDQSQGGFIADPLCDMERERISHEVVAVQPFYRGRLRALHSKVSSEWKTYFAMPGNLGLATSGNFLAARLTPAIRRMHRTQPFDLIHAHSALPCGHAAELLSRSLGIPFIVSVHGQDAFSIQQCETAMGGGAIGKLCKHVSERVYRSARAVICISKRVSDCVTEHVSANTVIVHNGVDPDRFHPAANSPSDLQSALVVLSVGNLIPIKGHDLLVRAFARCVNLIPGFVLDLEIIGDGPEREKLTRLAAELGVSARVRFRGRQSRQFVAEAMRRCAVFALPSRYEGLGCVYLEAMSSAKPVIACRDQGIDDLIEHGQNGWLVSPSSSPAGETELSEALCTVLGNAELRERLGSAARKTVLRAHTLTHQSRQLAEIYRECAR